MGAQIIQFDDFAVMVREPLCVLDVEPAFQHKDSDLARFMSTAAFRSIWPELGDF
jgi:hypothetical protein